MNRYGISLVEQRLVRTWLGNTRELLAESRAAAQAAAVEHAGRVTARHRSATAGCTVGDAMPGPLARCSCRCYGVG